VALIPLFPFFVGDFVDRLPFTDDELLVFATFGERFPFGESVTPASVEDRFVPAIIVVVVEVEVEGVVVPVALCSHFISFGR